MFLAYGSTAGDIDDVAERISRISDSEAFSQVGDAIAEYAYAGVGRKVRQTYGYDGTASTHAAQWLAWDAVGSGAPPPSFGGSYDALDTFGRTTNLHYRGGTPQDATLWRAEYAYDASDNRLWQLIVTGDGQGGLIDNQRSSLFGYDGLDRLISSELGSLDLTDPENPSISASTLLPVPRAHDWGLDTLGNWQQHTLTADDGSGQPQVTTADQIVNLRNELESIDDGDGDPLNDVQLTYDVAGSLTSDQTYSYHYDGLGRLVQVDEIGTGPSGADQWILHHTYDALGRLIRTQRPRPGSLGQGDTEIVTRRFYYDGVRRIQEILTEPVPDGPGGGGIGMGEEVTYVLNTTTDREYVHSPHYVDEVVCQFDTTGAPIFNLQDANYNVVALTDAAGNLLSTYTFDPYGQPVAVDTFAAHATNFLGHQGLFFDRLDAGANLPAMEAGAVGLFNARNRALHVGLGRWLQRDPNSSGQPVLGATSYLGQFTSPSLDNYDAVRQYGDGVNLFAAYAVNPTIRTDPAGLFIGLVAPMSVMDVYMDYNAEAIEAGGNLGSALSNMLSDYAEGQSVAADLVGDWSASDNLVGTFGAGGMAAVATIAGKGQRHHIIPRFLLGIDEGNIMRLPGDRHKDYHRILNEEFKRTVGWPVNKRNPPIRKWLTSPEAQTPRGQQRIAKMQAALLTAGRKFDELYPGYDVARRTREGLYAGHSASKWIRGGRGRRPR